MFDNQLDYRAIQKRADAAIKRRQSRIRVGLFVVNAVFYMVLMAAIWGLFLTRDFDYSNFTVAAMSALSAGWTVGVLLHGASLWANSQRALQRRRERAVAREIQHEMRRMNLDGDDTSGWDEKAKRRQRLVEIDDEDVQVNLADLIDHESAVREDRR